MKDQGNGPAGITCYMGSQALGFDSYPPNGLFERYETVPVRLRDITDGTSNVIAVGERSPSWSPWCAWGATNGSWFLSDYLPNQWTRVNGWKPDYTETSANGKYSASSWHQGGVFFLFSDGSVHFLSENMNFNVYQQLTIFNDALPTGGFGT